MDRGSSPYFSPVLLACIGEARLPEPGELAEVTRRIRREAFPHEPSRCGWDRARYIACVALGGTDELDDRWRLSTMEMIVPYQISLTAGDSTALDAEVHATATAALARVREMKTAGVEVTIMGPYGEKLSEDALVELASEETTDR